MQNQGTTVLNLESFNLVTFSTKFFCGGLDMCRKFDANVKLLICCKVIGTPCQNGLSNILGIGYAAAVQQHRIVSLSR